MNIIYFILASYGITQILVYGKIFHKIRPSYYFFHCPMCVGFWVGFFLWAINDHTELFTFDNSLVTAFILGSISSGSSYVLNMMFGDSGINFITRREK
jgi:steroid 5-alpha reductase family enzyme